jgi:hypothetical protein
MSEPADWGFWKSSPSKARSTRALLSAEHNVPLGQLTAGILRHLRELLSQNVYVLPLRVLVLSGKL